MICAYCKKNAKATKEHIISKSILDLFPECFATIDEERNVIHENDPMIKDVCSECNNFKLSYIDSYAKLLVEKYCLSEYDKDDILEFDYDYTLLQKVCVKYAFNDLRSRKQDTSFFNQEIIDWLLEENNTETKENITIIAGLAVNTSPAPNFLFQNKKLRWSKNPVFLANSLVKHVDNETGKIEPRESIEKENFHKLALSYLFRFNSIQIIMLCWNNDILDEERESNKDFLAIQYPYQILDMTGHSELSRCTSEITYHLERIIDVNWGQGIIDEISFLRGTFSEMHQQNLKELEQKWKLEEQRMAQQHPR